MARHPKSADDLLLPRRTPAKSDGIRADSKSVHYPLHTCLGHHHLRSIWLAPREPCDAITNSEIASHSPASEKNCWVSGTYKQQNLCYMRASSCDSCNVTVSCTFFAQICYYHLTVVFQRGLAKGELRRVSFRTSLLWEVLQACLLGVSFSSIRTPGTIMQIHAKMHMMGKINARIK